MMLLSTPVPILHVSATDGERLDRLGMGHRVISTAIRLLARLERFQARFSSRFYPALSAPVISNTRPVNGGIGGYSAITEGEQQRGRPAARKNIISSFVLRRPGLGNPRPEVLRWPVRFDCECQLDLVAKQHRVGLPERTATV
jgi:hypothetical protein